MSEYSSPTPPTQLRSVSKCPGCGGSAFDDDLCGDCAKRADHLEVEVEGGQKPTWDDTALYGVLGDLVWAVSPDTEAHQAAVYLDLLCRTGCTFNSGIFLGPYPRIPCRPFGCVIGPSGWGRKGTSHKVGATIFGDAGEFRQVDGWSSGQGIIHMMRDATGDDKLDLGYAKDKRHFFLEEECEKAQTLVHMPASTTGDTIKQLYDSRDKFDNPKIAHTKVTLPHAVFMYDATPRAWCNWPEREITNGFLNRFLCVYSEQTQRLPHGGNWLNDEVLRYQAELREAISLVRVMGEMTLSGPAMVLYERFYDEICDLQVDRGDHPLNDMIARAGDAVKRVAIISAALQGSRQIPAEAVEAAIVLWRYNLATVEWLWVKRGSDSASKAVAWHETRDGSAKVGLIIAALGTAQYQGLTSTDIQNGPLQRNCSSVQFRALMNALKDAGSVVDTTYKPARGKPGIRWYLKGFETRP